MLPGHARLTRSQDFQRVIRRGRRVGRGRLVVHLLRESSHSDSEPRRAGFVVSKAVGVAVVRHRVTRQLRHILRARMNQLPAGTLVVVRALPRAAGSSSDELASDVDAALRKLLNTG